MDYKQFREMNTTNITKADIILGSHPHVLQKMEERDIILPNDDMKKGFVIYSLGNFMSGQTKANTRNSIILTLDVIKSGETGKFSFENIKVLILK